MTCAALPVLRRKSGHQHAPFIAPAGKIVSLAALALIVWLFSSTSWSEARQALVAAAVGLLLYAAVARRRQSTLDLGFT